MGVINLTFYSGKLWHSDKPFPKGCSYESKVACGSAECLNDRCGFIRSWLSTAYDVVNPEVIGCTIIEMKRTKFFYGPPENGKQKQLSDGDQITLPDGYGIRNDYQVKDFKVNGGWLPISKELYVYDRDVVRPEKKAETRIIATITLPEKPSQYAINRKFDRLISSEIKSAMEKTDNSAHTHQDYAGDRIPLITPVEPSESQEETQALIGDFILAQYDIAPMHTVAGAYYHYADVCTLLNRLKEKLTLK